MDLRLHWTNSLTQYSFRSTEEVMELKLEGFNVAFDENFHTHT